ncbi:type VI secretion system tip protein TssI/VgrG [Pantoea sp. SS70]|uniref:type VI secretion system Vgr family protein n=1 Tax=Pantoea sp. SS70 TaxID=3024247 RepID=UPI0024532BA0|nr:type VI secretion system tip protein TssI/VgrG [Pantoea sp. SS70]WGK60097.1 type VI secretion system tip protein TssI/VgrG [Pantoea sp. SS70]
MSVLMNQGRRFIGWTSDYASKWVLLSLRGEEQLSTPFRWLARFTTADGADPGDALGKEVTCRIGEEKEQRLIHGVVTQLEQQHGQDGAGYFEALIEPRLVATRKRSGLRVFQNITVPDLVESLLKEHEITDVKRSLSGEYPEQEYYIQYRESDFDFIHRLLEAAGISYFFVHSDSAHQLVMADHANAWPASSVPDLPFHPVKGTQQNFGVLSWTVNRRLATIKAKDLNEHGYSSVASLSHLDANGEKESDRQKASAELRQERVEQTHHHYVGEMNAFWLSAGEHFSLTGHPSASNKYGVRKVLLSASNNLESANHYSCTVECWPLQQPQRPECVTAVPRIAGILTATVVGPDSEEIHTDEQGRVKIQFNWDEENKNDDSSSCWIRVAQAWAGGKFGALFLPRIGSEVLVSFLQGHPDHPVVTGSLYSDKNPLPVSLPEGKTHSGFVSRSTLEGEITEGHRIIFDDKKDEEKLIIDAQKDLLLTVLNDATTTVDNDVSVTIGKNRTSEITEGHDKLTLKKGNSELMLEDGDWIQTLKKGASRIFLKDGDFDLSIKGNQTVKLDGGDQKNTISGGGSQLKADKACVIESTESITFKVGGNEIAITTSGITIKGTQIELKGLAAVKVEGAQVEVKGSGMLTLDGGLIKIG